MKGEQLKQEIQVIITNYSQHYKRNNDEKKKKKQRIGLINCTLFLVHLCILKKVKHTFDITYLFIW